MFEIYYLLGEFVLLKPGSEIVGNLIGLIKNEYTTNLIFSTQTEIEMPNNSLSEDKLKSMIGKRIGIINIDDKYKIRKIQKKSKKVLEQKNTSKKDILVKNNKKDYPSKLNDKHKDVANQVDRFLTNYCKKSK